MSNQQLPFCVKQTSVPSNTDEENMNEFIGFIKDLKKEQDQLKQEIQTIVNIEDPNENDDSGMFGVAPETFDSSKEVQVAHHGHNSSFGPWPMGMAIMEKG